MSTTKDDSPLDNWGQDHSSKWMGYRVRLVEAPTVRTVVWLRHKKSDTEHWQCQCHQTNQELERSKYIEVRRYYAIPWCWYCARTHCRKKTTGKLAYKTNWTCSIWNTVPWKLESPLGSNEVTCAMSVVCRVLEEVVSLKHCTLDTCGVCAMCVYSQCRLDYALLCCCTPLFQPICTLFTKSHYKNSFDHTHDNYLEHLPFHYLIHSLHLC